MLNIALFREQTPTLRTCLPPKCQSVGLGDPTSLDREVSWAIVLGCNLPLKTFVCFIVVLGQHNRKEGGRDRLDLGTA